MDINIVRTLNEGSTYREIRAVGGGYDVVIRRPDLVFPLDLGIMAQKTLQCRNINTVSWFNYTVGNDTFYPNTRGLGTWIAGNNYIGYKANGGVCGNGVMFSGSVEENKQYQSIHGGYTPYSNVSGVFYIR